MAFAPEPEKAAVMPTTKSERISFIYNFPSLGECIPVVHNASERGENGARMQLACVRIGELYPLFMHSVTELGVILPNRRKNAPLGRNQVTYGKLNAC